MTLNAIVQAFVKKYKEKFNESPDHAAAQTYDAMQVLVKALQSSSLEFQRAPQSQVGTSN